MPRCECGREVDNVPAFLLASPINWRCGVCSDTVNHVEGNSTNWANKPGECGKQKRRRVPEVDSLE